MVKGRQITWRVYQHFKTSDLDGAMLQWDELTKLKLHGDNLSRFLSDWETTCLNVGQLPDENFMEEMFRTQLENSKQLTGPLALYWQEITQNGAPRSYAKLKKMVELFLEEQHLKHNQAALARNDRFANPAADPKSQSGPNSGPRTGMPSVGQGRQVQPWNGLPLGS